jgi:hypothetical protein
MNLEEAKEDNREIPPIWEGIQMLAVIPDTNTTN